MFTNISNSIFIPALLFLLLLFNSFPTTLAGGCDLLILCGDVINKTPFTMSATTVYKTGCSSTKIHYCMVWNRNKGKTWAPEPNNPVKCCHKPVKANGGKMGTNGVDVDAFTYATTDYIVLFDLFGTHLPGIDERTITKGQWTRISNTQYAECTQTGKRKKPYCRIVGMNGP